MADSEKTLDSSDKDLIKVSHTVSDFTDSSADLIVPRPFPDAYDEEAPFMPLPSSKFWMAFCTSIIMLLLSSLDQLILSTSLPDIGLSLGSTDKLAWVMTAASLAIAASSPLYGKWSDEIGRKPVYLFALILFIVASLICGFSINMNMLIVFRALQGVGTGGAYSLAQVILGDIITPARRGLYGGALGSVIGFSSAVGPMVGGILTEKAVAPNIYSLPGTSDSWRWCMWVLTPLALVAVVFVFLSIRKFTKGPNVTHKYDISGSLLLAAGVVCFLLPLTWGGKDYAWNSGVIIGLFVTAGVLGILFAINEYFHPEPIVPLSLFHIRNFHAASLVSFLLGVTKLATVAYLPQYLQLVKGMSPFMSGVYLIPLMIANIISSTITGILLSKTRFHVWIVASGSAVQCIGAFLLTSISPGTSMVAFCVYISLIGAGMGAVVENVFPIVQSTANINTIATISAFVSFTKPMGASIGVPIMQTILYNVFRSNMASNLAVLNAGLPPPQQYVLTPDLKELNRRFLNASPKIKTFPQSASLVSAILESYCDGYGKAFIFVGCVCVAQFLACFIFKYKPLRGKAHHPPEMQTKTLAIGQTSVPV